ncbi:MAG: restriction endonuclease subunit S [Betaproteobacteria bacterium]|nr:restriction endonuclease subunit S [Betaproteobacteria bacterium]
MAGEARLADLCESIVDCPHSTPVWTDSGVVVLRNQNIRNGRLVLTEPSYTDEAHFAERTRRAMPTEGDLVITREAPMGEVCMIPSDLRCCLGQRLVLLRPNRKRAEPRYLLYALQSKAVQHEIGVNEGTGSTVSNLRIPLLESLPIPTRPLSEQRAIAHILGTLDDKIELNRRMSETLEGMARALFKSWFVDFDPVRAKAEGRDPGLAKPIADLFPARLVHSELGEIPEGWEVGRFGEVVEQLRDQENPLSFPDVLYHHFSIPAFDEGQTAKAEFGESIKSLKSRVPPGVILMSKLNPEIERVWMVDVQPYDRSVCSTEFLVLRSRPPFTRGYAYCLARSPLFRQQIEGLVTGTSKSHQRAQVRSILDLAAVKPPARVVATFDGSAEAMLARTLECRREGRTLAALRDALLPKLISGELRVGDALQGVQAWEPATQEVFAESVGRHPRQVEDREHG